MAKKKQRPYRPAPPPPPEKSPNLLFSRLLSLRRIIGASIIALATGTAAGLIDQSTISSRVEVSLIFAFCCGISLYSYWVFAPKLGRATTLAALSLPWGLAILALGLFTPGDHNSANLAAYAISGIALPWLIGALTIPAAGFVRFGIHLQHWIKSRRANLKSKVTRRTANRTSQPRTNQQRTKPKVPTPTR